VLVVLLVEADVEPLPTVLDGVWLLTGGVVWLPVVPVVALWPVAVAD
jgi:hypothetical protein